MEPVKHRSPKPRVLIESLEPRELFAAGGLTGQYYDNADFNVRASNFGQSGRAWQQADFNGDGNVDTTDFNFLAANFGGTPARLTEDSGSITLNAGQKVDFQLEFFDSAGAASIDLKWSG